jgi:hypothetical protein
MMNVCEKKVALVHYSALLLEEGRRELHHRLLVPVTTNVKPL